MARLSPRVLIPRILYSTSYTILLLSILLLLVVTPGDHIYQILSDSKLGNIFVVGGTYFVTAVVALFIYASRLYTNRTTLAAIPKPYLPIEPGEVSSSIRKIIVRNFARSALIAWDSRPRDLNTEVLLHRRLEEDNAALAKEKTSDSGPLARINSRREKNRINQPMGVSIDFRDPPWGAVEHPGWSGPSTIDLPNLHFATVISELPNLIEAKAVSLASSDVLPTEGASCLSHTSESAMIALLQRTPSTEIRKYLDQLEALGVISDTEVRVEFLDHFEYARFSGSVLTDTEFRVMMAVFSRLIEGMDVLVPSAVEIMSDSVEPDSVVGPNFGRIVPLVDERNDVTSSTQSESAQPHNIEEAAITRLQKFVPTSPSSSSVSLDSVVIHRDKPD